MQDPSTLLLSWFRSISRSDKQTFNQFYYAYYHRLKRFAFQMLKEETAAEEVVSDLFVKIWLNRKGITQIHKPQFYIYQATKNACLNELRKKNNTFMQPLSLTEEPSIPSEGDPMAFIQNKELIQLLDAAVNTLPDQRKMIFKMVKEEGLKHKEVAQLLDISVRTVENQIYKAIQYLATYLEAYLERNPLQKGKLKIKNYRLLFL